VIVERLTTRHDRAAFDCGVESLNLFLRQYARQNASQDISKTYVGLSQAKATHVEGYYTVSVGAVRFEELPQEPLPQYPIPIVHLGRLAVDKNSQGQGLGQGLMLDALERVAKASQEIGIFAVEVRALNDDARRFYVHFGFQPLADDPLHLYLTLRAIRKLGLY
jgi:ribosomal protein S18 acetylase RimI-like enzyme